MANTCKDCPNYWHGWCKIYAAQFVPDHPSCKKGDNVIRAKRILEIRRANADAKTVSE